MEFNVRVCFKECSRPTANIASVRVLRRVGGVDCVCSDHNSFMAPITDVVGAVGMHHGFCFTHGMKNERSQKPAIRVA